MTPRRVVLLGFMASGKTEVGKRLATRLGWQHIDLDAEIEKIAGMPVDRIFSTMGEPEFRRLEVKLSRDLFNRSATVFSPGGGWVANPGAMDSLPPDTLTVWLRVSSAEVMRRLDAAADQPVRPMLLSADRAVRIEELLSRREPLYRQAHVWIETDERSTEEVVDLIMEEMRRDRPALADSSSNE